jgi:glycosyltransferase involved in cell wall biosynthesis
MAMGLPVISTTSGAIPEMVEDGVSGILVPPADSSALADALERLSRDAALRERLGRSARRVIEERFDGSRNVEQRLTLFGRGA